ncbi:hypothetical protein [uncultured Sphingorhabdus sp.]|uniref:hypothetical protein n=1 Tax=uncultured Sphingorhabdus sp. TaxID=1686106 RepID=UPI002622F998|nr:hypothetical protein [uncultured Sphingorhabdus sp.]
MLGIGEDMNIGLRRHSCHSKLVPHPRIAAVHSGQLPTEGFFGFQVGKEPSRRKLQGSSHVDFAGKASMELVVMKAT